MHAYYLFIRLIVEVNLVWFWPETEQKLNTFIQQYFYVQQCKFTEVLKDPTKFDLLAEYWCFSVLVLTRKILRLMIKWPNSMVYSCCKSMNELGSDSRIFRGL